MKDNHKNTLLPSLTGLAFFVITALLVTIVITKNHGWAEKNIAVPPDSSAKKNALFIPLANGKEIRFRPQTVAGQFYPAVPQLLKEQVDRLLAEKTRSIKKTRAILVPHAGYVYSGNVAASSFKQVSPDFRLVFLLAGNHNSAENFRGVSIPDFTHYEIPGSKVPIAAIVKELKDNDLFVSKPLAHINHMIEVELPFLQALKGWPEEPDYVIVPLITGALSSEDTLKLVQILNTYNSPQTLYIFSVDLSHYYTDKLARKFDMESVNAIMSMDSQILAGAVTDANQVLTTMVELARANDWEPTSLQYSNSGDVNGDQNRVVGYSSIVFHESLSFTVDEKKEILALARQSVEQYLVTGKYPQTDMEILKKIPAAKLPRAVFVTLKKNGQLRGCIGDIISNEPLYKNIISCAIKAATSDPRFNAVSRSELDSLTLSVSVLQYPQQVAAAPSDYPKVIRPGKDGIILINNGRQSTYLPQVWEQLPDPVDFLSRLCVKQGAPAACWLEPSTKLYRYSAYEFGELDL